MPKFFFKIAVMATFLGCKNVMALSHQQPSSRRNVLSSVAAALVGTTLNPSTTHAEPSKDDQVQVFETPSGLKYINVKESSSTNNSKTPRYGQLLSIKYTGYIKLPNQDKQQFDSGSYLIKHGNGRTIPGLDEGLHTMKSGDVRRLIIPPKLGYVRVGLGPLPESPLARYKLSNLLDKMVEQRGGNVIFDVELVSFMDDEADQGYYDDASLTPEQFDTLRTNLQKKAADAQKSRGEGGGSGVAAL